MIFLRANNALRDCELALEVLESERNVDLWRVHWVGAVALVRAVGHILRHVDRVEFPQLAPTIDAAFATWKVGEEHRIFREFIDQERNNILKEYRSSIHDLPIVRLSADQVDGRPAVMWEPDGEGGVTEFFELDENLYRPRMTGFMAGEDARDIYREAIEWWQRELNSITD